MMDQYSLNGFKTLVSNDYNLIVEELIKYFEDVRLKCPFCSRKLNSYDSLKSHIKGFHKITERN